MQINNEISPGMCSVSERGTTVSIITPFDSTNPGNFVMGKTNNYVSGEVIGNCIYLYRTGRKNKRSSYAMFKCECGKEFETLINSVKMGKTRSCGCLLSRRTIERNTVHGLCKNKLYHRWTGMKSRCYSKSHKRYDDWGGRGIKVCDEWVNDFRSYYDYIMLLPNAMKNGYSIDRIDNDGNYEPGNIRWATNLQQNNNKRPRKDLFN